MQNSRSECNCRYSNRYILKNDRVNQIWVIYFKCSSGSSYLKEGWGKSFDKTNNYCWWHFGVQMFSEWIFSKIPFHISIFQLIGAKQNKNLFTWESNHFKTFWRFLNHDSTFNVYFHVKEPKSSEMFWTSDIIKALRGRNLNACSIFSCQKYYHKCERINMAFNN